MPNTDWQSQLKSNRKAIDFIKELVYEKHPELKGESNLNDGSVIDDLFFLRYVLSSKQPLDSIQQVRDSRAYQHVLECLQYKHFEQNVGTLDSCSRASLVCTIPLMKTGELSDGTPVLYLPVKDVDLGLISKTKHDKVFRQNLLDLLLAQRAEVYSELDTKTRERGSIVKAITVYDMNEMSFKDLYKMKNFFELVQTQGKLFKKLFPQSTLVNVFVNSPGSFLLKSLLTSSKQKVMSAKKFIQTYNAYTAVPDIIGGTFVWPRTKEHLLKLAEGADFKNMDQKELPKEEISVKEVESAVYTFDSKFKNKKICLEEMERQMVKLSKNRLFSISVLEPNQQVNVFFSNMKKKDANVLVEIRQQGQQYKKAMRVPSGFFNIPFTLQTKGEIIFTYVDESKAKLYGNGLTASIESMKLRRGPAKKLIRYGKKAGKKHINAFKGSKVDKALRKMDYAAVRKYQQQDQLKRMGVAEKDRVFFRFEVTDAVVCGNFGGEEVLTDQKLEEIERLPLAPHEITEDLDEFDGRSLQSMESREMREREAEYPSFFSKAAGIMMRGW